MLFRHQRTSEIKTNQEKKRELECEEAIIAEKTRFERVRKTFMEYMREEYGSRMANRILRRISKRRTEGYLQRK